MIYYTDGSCNNNGHFPNKGGFGIVEFDLDGNVIDAWSESHKNTTNNREEMLAILKIMKMRGHYIFDEWGFVPRVYTDSSYAHQTFTQWMFNWANNNWFRNNGSEPENLDIIKEFYNHYQKGYRIELVKIKGHNGVLGNELADQLATGKITPQEVIEKYGNK